MAEIAQAIGHPHRLELLEYLAQGPHSVEELTARTKLNFANTSRHLQILRRARLVETERRGKNVIYSIASHEEVIALLRALGGVGERNRAEISQVMADYFTARDALSPVSREELLVQLREGAVTLIDVRPEQEFQLGHLPGALNIPMEQLEKEFSRLPKNQTIVAYCRGPYCVLSFEAVEWLRGRGYKVRRLAEGFPEWKAAGLTVETSE
nr:metalloregulator ArsR/SmtB family transcription factor [Achromobacter xylosoxidans]